MKETGILFKPEMVRARLAGLKTQTRRLVKPQPDHVNKLGIPFYPYGKGPVDYRLCPYGVPGDRLWVRETWGMSFEDIVPKGRQFISGGTWGSQDRPHRKPCVVFLSDGDMPSNSPWETARWSPSTQMPRWASRITLEIISVRVERLQDITEEDAIAEGCSPELRAEGTLYRGPIHPVKGTHKVYPCAKAAYRALWESINGHGSWDLNPWLWVIEFKEVKP